MLIWKVAKVDKRTKANNTFTLRKRSMNFNNRANSTDTKRTTQCFQTTTVQIFQEALNNDTSCIFTVL